MNAARRPRSFFRFAIPALCLGSVIVGTAAHADHKYLILNFDQDVETTGSTGVVVSGAGFLTTLAIGTTDDEARDAIAAMIDADASFSTIPVGDTTLWVFATGGGDITSAAVGGNQGTQVSGRIVASDVLIIDVDPKDTSADVETDSTNTTGSAAASELSVTIGAAPAYTFAPGAADDDQAAATGLFAAGIGALTGAVRVGATTILVPHCVTDSSGSASTDPNLGVSHVEMDVHLPCLNPPGDTDPAGVSVGLIGIPTPSLSPVGMVCLAILLAIGSGVALRLVPKTGIGT